MGRLDPKDGVRGSLTIEERLGFDALFEFSLGVNQSRSLEATGCSTLSVVPEHLGRAAAAFAEVLREEAPVPAAARAPAAELERLAGRYLLPGSGGN